MNSAGETSRYFRHKGVFFDAGSEGPGHGGDNIPVEVADVLLDGHEMFLVGRRIRLNLPPPEKAAVLLLDAAGIHAGIKFSGKGQVVDPVHPEGRLVRIRGVGKIGRPGAVGKHPPQEVGVEGKKGALVDIRPGFRHGGKER